MNVIQASPARARTLAGIALVLVGLTIWAVRHVLSSVQIVRGHGTQFATIYALAFAMLVWQTVLYTLERPKKVTARQQERLDRLVVAVPVPVYNEDPGYLAKCLASVLNQERLPQIVYVVDDGSSVDYGGLRTWFLDECFARGVAGYWKRTHNQGKRHAQGHAVRALTGEGIDVYVTVDSDANLAPDAIHELLKPLASPKVQCVAGVVLAENNRKNLLTRFTDLWFVTGQLVDRSAMSTMGAVLVNSGVLAAYRAALVEENLDGYLNETFFGRKVEFSDDSMLTIYALARGKAVQQPTAFAFTAMPEKLSHHVRQYVRWMRGAFIRSWWRFKYLPLNSYAYWGHLIAWTQMVLSTVVFGVLFVVRPAIDHRIMPTLILIPVLVGYAQALRYLSFRRSDEPLWSQVLTFLISPVAMLWAFFVLRAVRWYGMATCWSALEKPNSWGTRQNGVEVATGGPLTASQGVPGPREPEVATSLGYVPLEDLMR
jgi:hyaluronan synthase